MKKCPKCGTILDDSKRKCYMCGADLQKRASLNFGETFNDDIGATVSKSQDNVFGAAENISVNVDDVVNSDNSNVTFSSSSSSADIYKDQINSLNSMQYDERSALEKIFSSDARFRNKDEINALEAMKKNSKSKKKNNATKKNSVENTDAVQKRAKKETPPPLMPPLENTNSIPQQNISQQSIVQKPAINWGNNLLNGNNNDVSGYKDKVSKKFSVSPSFIFNSICFVLFILFMGYMYFNYIKPRVDEKTSFGGLHYKIDSKFILKNDDNYSRYYTYGEDCALRINYGPTGNVDGFVENFFEGVRAEYESKKGYTTMQEEIKIQDNVWSALSVIQLQENTAGPGGYSSKTKYKYVSIVYKGNFYDIRYVNIQDDGTCSSMYDAFVQTLAFDK